MRRRRVLVALVCVCALHTAAGVSLSKDGPDRIASIMFGHAEEGHSKKPEGWHVEGGSLGLMRLKETHVSTRTAPAASAAPGAKAASAPAARPEQRQQQQQQRQRQRGLRGASPPPEAGYDLSRTAADPSLMPQARRVPQNPRGGGAPRRAAAAPGPMRFKEARVSVRAPAPSARPATPMPPMPPVRRQAAAPRVQRVASQFRFQQVRQPAAPVQQVRYVQQAAAPVQRVQYVQQVPVQRVQYVQQVVAAPVQQAAQQMRFQEVRKQKLYPSTFPAAVSMEGYPLPGGIVQAGQPGGFAGIGPGGPYARQIQAPQALSYAQQPPGKLQAAQAALGGIGAVSMGHPVYAAHQPAAQYAGHYGKVISGQPATYPTTTVITQPNPAAAVANPMFAKIPLGPAITPGAAFIGAGARAGMPTTVAPGLPGTAIVAQPTYTIPGNAAVVGQPVTHPNYGAGVGGAMVLPGAQIMQGQQAPLANQFGGLHPDVNQLNVYAQAQAMVAQMQAEQAKKDDKSSSSSESPAPAPMLGLMGLMPPPMPPGSMGYQEATAPPPPETLVETPNILPAPTPPLSPLQMRRYTTQDDTGYGMAPSTRVEPEGGSMAVEMVMPGTSGYQATPNAPLNRAQTMGGGSSAVGMPGGSLNMGEGPSQWNQQVGSSRR